MKKHPKLTHTQKIYLVILCEMPKAHQFLIQLTEEEAQWLHHRHNNILVIFAIIENNKVKWILVDTSNSIDILLFDIFSKIEFTRDHQGKNRIPLTSFERAQLSQMTISNCS